MENKRYNVYKCEICGNIVEMLESGQGKLVCCNQEMTLLKEKKQETGNEKHLPVVDINNNHIFVKVGSVEHPMNSDHYIQWIELITDKKAYKKYLNPNEKPEAEFIISSESREKVIKVRAYCNLHGLWAVEL